MQSAVTLMLVTLVGSAVGRALYLDLLGLPKKRADCPVYKNEAMHAVFDRICDMCHEMFHLTSPNLRTECRDNCFDNDQFKICLSQYNPGSGGGLSIPPVVRRSSKWTFY